MRALSGPGNEEEAERVPPAGRITEPLGNDIEVLRPAFGREARFGSAVVSVLGVVDGLDDLPGLHRGHPVVENRLALGHHGEFAQRAFRLAQALRALGVGPGDRVAVLAQNCPEYMEAYAAGEFAGWTTVTINFRLASAEIAYILSDSKPKCLIVDAQFVDKLPNVAAAGVRHVITFGGPGPDLGYEDVLTKSEARRPDVAVQPDDIAHLVYTSGTTGNPKGALGTHRNITTNIFSTAYGAARSALRRGETPPAPVQKVSLTVIPLFHVTACSAGMMGAVFAGHTLVFMLSCLAVAFLQNLVTWFRLRAIVENLPRTSEPMPLAERLQPVAALAPTWFVKAYLVFLAVLFVGILVMALVDAMNGAWISVVNSLIALVLIGLFLAYTHALLGAKPRSPQQT